MSGRRGQGLLGRTLGLARAAARRRGAIIYRFAGIAKIWNSMTESISLRYLLNFF